MNSRMTAYDSNTRAHTPAASNTMAAWSPKIDRLVAQDYSFTGLKYSDEGVLFRGMSSGLANGLNNNAFGRFEDDKPHAQLEQQLDVLFVSHDLSDAISCSRIWEAAEDAGILVLSTQVFNEAYDQHEAAMMRFAEPGVVFNYPLLCRDISMHDVMFLFINHATETALQRSGCNFESLNQKLFVFDEPDRGAFERAMLDSLVVRQLVKAVPVAADDWPGRKV